MSVGVWRYNEIFCESWWLTICGELVVVEVDLILAICAAPLDENSYETKKGGGALTEFMLRVLYKYGELSMNILRFEILRKEKNFVVTCSRSIDCDAIFWKLDIEYMKET